LDILNNVFTKSRSTTQQTWSIKAPTSILQAVERNEDRQAAILTARRLAAKK
jgi:hypothetical protein